MVSLLRSGESWGRFSDPRDFVTGSCYRKKGAMKKLSSLLHSHDAFGNENENQNENFVLTKMKTRTGICKVERRIEDTKRLHNYLTHNNRKRNSPGVQHQRSDEYSCE